MKKEVYCIYMHKNKKNNKAYIGITKQKPELRWKYGNGYNKQPKFFRAILKYGWDNFEHIILQKDIADEKEALKQESYYIKKYDTVNNGYNVLDNSLEHPSYTVQYIPIYCIENKTYYQSIGEAARELNIFRGDIEKVIRGERNGCYGLHFLRKSEVTKENVEKALKKRTGRFRKVFCEENKKVFNSLQDAANFCNRSTQSVLLNCQGKRKTCGGYHFKYYEESEAIYEEI